MTFTDFVLRITPPLTLAAIAAVGSFMFTAQQRLGALNANMESVVRDNTAKNVVIQDLIAGATNTKTDHRNMFENLARLNEALAQTNQEIAIARSSLSDLTSLTRDLDAHVTGLSRENVELRLRLESLEDRVREIEGR